MSSPTSRVIQLPHEIVRAGAGAGKTTGLIQKVIDVYEHFKKFETRPRVVITTFSRKATQEVKERLLIKALNSGDEGFLEFVSSSHTVLVTTIHGVLLQFLSRYGIKMGLTADFQFREAAYLRRRDMQILRSLMKSMDLQNLLSEWRLTELVSAANLFYAHRWSGSWKQFLDEKLIYQTLREICGEAHRLAKDITEEIRTSAHPKWLELIEPMIRVCGILENANVTKDTFDGLFANLKSLRAELQKPRRSGKNESLNELHERFEHLQELIDSVVAQDPMMLQRQITLFQDIERLFISYSDLRLNKTLEKGDLNFSDLEILSARLIEQVPEAAKGFSEEWNYWLVDEYQDTSPLQVHLLKHLIGQQPHFVVGDPQQSIYLFRGARSEVFEHKEREIENQGGVLRALMRNYRSTPQLLSFINELFARFEGRFRSMLPKDEVHDAKDVVAHICWAQDSRDEIRTAVNKVKALLSQSVRPEDICILARRRQHLKMLARALQNEGVPYFVHISSGFADRREVHDVLALLRFAFVPQDAANLIQLCRSPWFRVTDDEIASVRANRAFYENVSETKDSFWQVLCKELLDHSSIQRLKDYMYRCETLGVREAILKTLNDVGFFQVSQTLDGSGRREANTWKLMKLIEAIEKDPTQNFLNLEASIYEGQSSTEDAAADAVSAIEPDRVNLMTVHGSKGLQFDHVLIPFTGEQSRYSHIPLFYCDEETGVASLKCRDENEDRAHFRWVEQQFRRHRQREELESERLLYVAVTRAKKSLYFSSIKKPAVSSWAQFLKKEFGLHQQEQFAVLVEGTEEHLAAASESTVTLNRSVDTLAIRKPWRERGGLNTQVQARGVTALVEEGVFHVPGKIETGVDHGALWRRVEKGEQGVILHRLFEALRYHGANGVQRVIEKSFASQSEQIAEALQFVVQLEEPPMVELLKSGYAEWGFTVRKSDQWVRGQIDLWGIVDREVWIVDYKTGHLDLEKAFLQLSIYAEALQIARKSKDSTKIKLAVIQPFIQTTVVRLFREL